MDRHCSRPGCAEPGTATLTYQYERGAAWLDALSPHRDPHSYDLCQRHAVRLTVPLGWRIEDRRVLVVVAPAPPEALPAPRPEAAVPGLPHRLAG